MGGAVRQPLFILHKEKTDMAQNTMLHKVTFVPENKVIEVEDRKSIFETIFLILTSHLTLSTSKTGDFNFSIIVF